MLSSLKSLSLSRTRTRTRTNTANINYNGKIKKKNSCFLSYTSHLAINCQFLKNLRNYIDHKRGQQFLKLQLLFLILQKWEAWKKKSIYFHYLAFVTCIIEILEKKTCLLFFDQIGEETGQDSTSYRPSICCMHQEKRPY